MYITKSISQTVKPMKYNVKYSSRKTISIQITREAEVVVLAPYHTAPEKIEELVHTHEDWISTHIKKMERRIDSTPNLSEEEIQKMKIEAKQKLSEMVERFSRFMDLEYGRITITSAKSRFGSCSSDGNLSFSYRCMFYPLEVQEYIVVHELSHLVHMDHSKDFYKLVSSVLPDYKKRAQYLKLPIGTPYK